MFFIRVEPDFIPSSLSAILNDGTLQVEFERDHCNIYLFTYINVFLTDRFSSNLLNLLAFPHCQ